MSTSSSIPKIITTADGSNSLYVASLDETYHSKHGALQESKWIFIEHGLKVIAGRQKSLSVLEVGFGTGLNAWLTWNFAEEILDNLYYTTLDTYIVPVEIYQELEFPLPNRERFLQLHEALWNKSVQFSPKFTLQKLNESIHDFSLDKSKFDLVYYDAFGPRAQPEMWEIHIFQRIYGAMSAGGILVTYCSKGQVRRDLQACGFRVEKLPGPPGKREMITAFKS